MTIKDKNLEPYEIIHDGFCYRVTENTGRRNKQDEDIYKVHAYCSSVANAINKVIKLKIETSSATYNLKEYADKLKAITNEINQILS
ncbi:hypothetical protein GO491_11890 [Flavobacteriaceae bacterium Ap0902]|nr:hypothetical protein [Flavobacteriaceae bacterium Ap0902]